MLSIEEFQRINRAENIIITQHSRKRMAERGIVLADVMNAFKSGEIIEQYPNDFPFPSCLILGNATDSRPIHVVASVNENMIYLITAYCPNSESWETDMKTRKDG